jgi:hypothetical protein
MRCKFRVSIDVYRTIERGDWDNYGKILDGLNPRRAKGTQPAVPGVLWSDDGRVPRRERRRARNRLVRDAVKPGVLVADWRRGANQVASRQHDATIANQRHAGAASVFATAVDETVRRFKVEGEQGAGSRHRSPHAATGTAPLVTRDMTRRAGHDGRRLPMAHAPTVDLLDLSRSAAARRERPLALSHAANS